VMDLGPQADVDPDWPYCWDAEGVYFRVDGNALLASPCDEDPVSPGVPGLDPRQLDALEHKLAVAFPAVAGRPVWRMWAGLRTFAPDRQFVIGWDGTCDRLFWVAGLGGHGLTTAPAVGDIAARLLLAGPGERHPSFDPARFRSALT
jgi:D-arginine dehydrogenase